METLPSEFLAQKHTGMKISASGILGRIRDGWKLDEGTRFCCGEMLRHLEETSRRFYSGDIQVIDEFLQLYCLAKDRPK